MAVMYIMEGPACSAALWHTGHAASVSRRGKGEAIVFGDVPRSGLVCGRSERSETKSVKSGSNRKEGAAPGPKPHRGPVLQVRDQVRGAGETMPASTRSNIQFKVVAAGYEMEMPTLHCEAVIHVSGDRACGLRFVGGSV
jgi:hypothetical protein